VRLDDVEAFVFDVDGTLVHRAPESVDPIPGAVDVLERIRASGRPFALFTNGSHLAPAAFAQEFRAAGLPIEDGQVVTPLCSVQAYLERFRRDAAILPFATDAARAYLEEVGVRLVDGRNGSAADAVFVAHVNETDFEQLERAARSVIAGARLLTGSYVPAYAGADGPILSRGAMITAAIAKASGGRPVVVGTPSKAAVRELEKRLGVPSERIAVVGDDVRLDIALGNLGGSRTVLVRSGISAGVTVDGLPERTRPHLAVDTVADLIEAL
jgi:HAD superfamily hydrolase (TIGR01450 family)